MCNNKHRLVIIFWHLFLLLLDFVHNSMTRCRVAVAFSAFVVVAFVDAACIGEPFRLLTKDWPHCFDNLVPKCKECKECKVHLHSTLNALCICHYCAVVHREWRWEKEKKKEFSTILIAISEYMLTRLFRSFFFSSVPLSHTIARTHAHNKCDTEIESISRSLGRTGDRV